MKQTHRPAQITEILTTMDADSGACMEAYLSDLEAKQQETTPLKDASPTVPIWSHQRIMKRQQRRQERAARERNNYQTVTQATFTTLESK